MRYSMLVILAVVLLGCGRTSSSTGGQPNAAVPTGTSPAATATSAPTATSVPTATVVPTASKPAATAQPTRPPAGPLAVLQTEGGLKGAVLLVTVEQDGQVSYAVQETPDPQVLRWQATPDQLQRLQALLARPEFAALQESYVPENTCCDRIEYTLSVMTPAGERVVRTLDGVENPPVLQQTLDLLGEIIRAGTRR